MVGNARSIVAALLVGAVVATATSLYSQDLNTQLTNFIIDMRAGTLGVNQTVTSIALGDGTAAAPAVTFASDIDNGLYLAATNQLGAAAAGSDIWRGVSGGIFAVTTLALDISNRDIVLTRGGAGLLNVSDADGTPDINLNVSGIPTVGTCGDAAVSTGSSNSAGAVTGTTQTACTVTFSATFGGNSTACVVQNLTTEGQGFVSASSSTAFTVSGLTAGDDFSYICVGY